MNTLVELLVQRAECYGDRVAYTYVRTSTDIGTSITYQQLCQESVALASHLLGKVGPGERALLLYPAGIDFVIAFYACIVAGIIAVPLYPPGSSRKFGRLEAILHDAAPKLLLTVSSSLSTVKLGLGKWIETEGIDCIATDDVEKLEPGRRGSSICENDIAMLQYTSGSTGSPKGVMVSHRNIWHNSDCIQQAFQLSSNSCSVSWLPHFHDMGLIDGIIQPLFSGFHGVLLAPETFVKRPLTWLRLISRFKATHCGGPNSAYALCIQRVTESDLTEIDLSHWHSAYCGAEPIRPETLERFTSIFNTCGFRNESWFPCYGMAEATLMISGGCVNSSPVVISIDSRELAANKAVEVAGTSEETTRLVGCGHTWLGTSARIVDPNTLLPCEDGIVGEIWVAGPSVASGYWQQPELSSQNFQVTQPSSQSQGYLRTGDLGFIKGEEIFVTGRRKDVIIISGQNIYPQDVEHTVQACCDDLAKNRGVAFSLTRQGEEGEHVVIVQELKRTQMTTIQPTKIFGLLREEISRHHGFSVSAILLVKPAAIPITSSGKIQRHLCRDRFLEKTLPVVAQWSILKDS